MNGRRILIVALTAIGVATWVAAVAAAPSACKLVKVAEWPVRYEHGQVIVDGAINGRKMDILLDTGAGYSLIMHSAVVQLGLAVRPFGDVRVFGVGGETNVSAASINEFRIGETVRKDWMVVVGGAADPGAGGSFVLGEDFFGKLDVEFDLAHSTVRLFVPKDCAGVPLAYWATGGFGEVDLEDSSSDRRILFTVRINDKPVLAMLDSGAGTTVLNKLDAARLGVTPETPGVVAVGVGGGIGPKTIQLWNGAFASFAIGNETIKDTTIRIADLWHGMRETSPGRAPQAFGGMPGMLLGSDFLHSHRVLISHSQHKMYFTYLGGPVFSTMWRAGSAEAPTDGEPETAGAK